MITNKKKKMLDKLFEMEEGTNPDEVMSEDLDEEVPEMIKELDKEGKLKVLGDMEGIEIKEIKIIPMKKKKKEEDESEEDEMIDC